MKRIKRETWMHIALALVIILFVGGVLYKITNFGEHISLEEIFKDGEGTYDDTFDSILPLVTIEDEPVYKNYGPDTDILFFGNDPLADDRDSENNLVNMIQAKTGATVYNCAISGSYLSVENETLIPHRYPMDAFSFYWLSFLPTAESIQNSYQTAIKTLGENCPPEATEVFETLTSIDFNEIDVIALMYDANDYLAGRPMYSDENFTNIETFTGNMAAGIQFIRSYYPHIRIMVLSPTYAYGLDEEGNYISSDIQIYGEQHFLSTYVIKQAEACALTSTTFIDNLYGTITENTADTYLTDHIHLSVEGRELVADRFVEALYYYNNETE